jgi:single-stranded-DNA-specific exonuclease
VVEISGENRKLVYDGLNYLKNTDRVGLLALCEVANIDLESIDAVSIAFKIVPRINASGRFGSPKTALELLTSEDEDTAYSLANQLCDLNNQRKDTENEIVRQIELQIADRPQLLNERVLVFSGENFHHGVIGIVASRFCEKYDKPCFIITNEGNNSSRGSARGIGNFNVFECLEYCKPVLERSGGHQGAGGFSLKTENVEEFTKLILQYADETFKYMPKTTYNIDALLLPQDITVDNVRSLSLLEPFGEGNKEPRFVIMGATLKEIIQLSNNTIKFRVQYSGKYLDIIQFGKNADEVFLKPNSNCDFLVKLSINAYNSRESVTIRAIDYRLSGLDPVKFFFALDMYEKILRGVTLPDGYYAKVTPTYQELTLVYSLMLKLNPIDVESLYLTININHDINYCKLRLSVDIFCELGLATFNPSDLSVRVVQGHAKVNLEDSEILRRLKNHG